MESRQDATGRNHYCLTGTVLLWANVRFEST